MTKKVLITGVTGFAGSHLAELLLSKTQISLYGTYLSDTSLTNIQFIQDKLTLIKTDLTKKEDTSALIEKVQPDEVYHLAALPAVGASFDKPLETIMNNIASQLHLLEALKDKKLVNTRILIVSSADVYGKVTAADIPIKEETKLNPANAYAVSKIAQDFLGLQYFNAFSLKIIRVRPFNHFGPRQTIGFVVADFAKKIAEIEKGKRDSILMVGNVEVKRDFTDVRDMVKAYMQLVEKGEAGDVYNVGSGKSYKISEMLQILLSFSKIKIDIQVDQALLRPNDVADRRCDTTKIQKVTGWSSTIPIETTLKETLDYWRNIV